MQQLLREMHTWMTAYMKSFYTADKEVMQGILIKETHTGYVTANMVALAKHLGLDAHGRQLAEIMGLFHDVGRFRQYSLYKTFNDAQSEDHAALALKVLAELPLMRRLAAEDRALVRFAIKNHNKKAIEPTEDARSLLFAKMLRDADKLDIYRVLAPYLSASGAEAAPNFVASLRRQDVSPAFVRALVEGRQADYHAIRTHGDRKVVRLLWIYDIYFSWTMREIARKGYIDKVIHALPHGRELTLGFERVKSYVAAKCAQEDVPVSCEMAVREHRLPDIERISQ